MDLVKATALNKLCLVRATCSQGRARATAQGLVQLDELYYAGSHGFDITGPLRKRTRSTSVSEVTRSVGDHGDGNAEEVAMPSLSYQVSLASVEHVRVTERAAERLTGRHAVSVCPMCLLPRWHLC